MAESDRHTDVGVPPVKLRVTYGAMDGYERPPRGCWCTTKSSSPRHRGSSEQVKKKTGFPISLRRFGNDANTDVSVSRSHGWLRATADMDVGVSRSQGCEGGTAFTDVDVSTISSSPRNRGSSATSEAENWIPNIAQAIWE
mgnify:CR=1 FL=1